MWEHSNPSREQFRSLSKRHAGTFELPGNGGAQRGNWMKKNLSDERDPRSSRRTVNLSGIFGFDRWHKAFPPEVLGFGSRWGFEAKRDEERFAAKLTRVLLLCFTAMWGRDGDCAPLLLTYNAIQDAVLVVIVMWSNQNTVLFGCL